MGATERSRSFILFLGGKTGKKIPNHQVQSLKKWFQQSSENQVSWKDGLLCFIFMFYLVASKTLLYLLLACMNFTLDSAD